MGDPIRDYLREEARQRRQTQIRFIANLVLGAVAAAVCVWAMIVIVLTLS